MRWPRWARRELDEVEVGEEFAGAEVVAAGLVGVSPASRSRVLTIFCRMQVALSR
ncbi:hypothetical protein SANTM175S_04286 [Streptomyces antimycoticus]